MLALIYFGIVFGVCLLIEKCYELYYLSRITTSLEDREYYSPLLNTV